MNYQTKRQGDRSDLTVCMKRIRTACLYIHVALNKQTVMGRISYVRDEREKKKSSYDYDERNT